MKTEEVIQWIIKHASLRGKLFPLCDCTPTLRQNLKLGALYWHGYDRNYRPLLVVNLKRLKPIESNNEQLVELFVFNFEYFIQHLQVAGRVENWKILIDCEGRSIMDLAPETISTMSGWQVGRSHSEGFGCALPWKAGPDGRLQLSVVAQHSVLLCDGIHAASIGRESRFHT